MSLIREFRTLSGGQQKLSKGQKLGEINSVIFVSLDSSLRGHVCGVGGMGWCKIEGRDSSRRLAFKCVDRASARTAAGRCRGEEAFEGQ